MDHGRRAFVLGLAASPITLGTSRLIAQARTIWSADEAYDALRTDGERMIDDRSRDEWLETGVGAGIWPISMHPTSPMKVNTTLGTNLDNNGKIPSAHGGENRFDMWLAERTRPGSNVLQHLRH